MASRRWYFHGPKEDEWFAYGESDASVLEAAYSSDPRGKHLVQLGPRKFLYEVDLVAMVQRNTKTGIQRLIKVQEEPAVGTKEIADIFAHIDKKGDGRLSKEELTEVLSELGMARSAVRTLLMAADTDRSGDLDYRKFVAWICGGSDIAKEVSSRFASRRVASDIVTVGNSSRACAESSQAGDMLVLQNRDGHSTVFIHPPDGHSASLKVPNGTLTRKVRERGDSWVVKYDGEDWLVKRHHALEAARESVPAPAPAPPRTSAGFIQHCVVISDSGLLAKNAEGGFDEETVPEPGEVVVEPVNVNLLGLQQLAGDEGIAKHGGPINQNIHSYLNDQCRIEYGTYDVEVREYLGAGGANGPAGRVCGAKYHKYGANDNILEVIAVISPNFNRPEDPNKYSGDDSAPFRNCPEFFKAHDQNGVKVVTQVQEEQALECLKVIYRSIFCSMIQAGKKKLRMAPIASGNNAGNFSQRMGRLTMQALDQVFQEMKSENPDNGSAMLESKITFCIYPDFNKPGRRLTYLQEQQKLSRGSCAYSRWDHYEFVLDDSGSMSPQRDAVIAGYNKFLENLVEKLDGQTRVTFALQKFGQNDTVDNNPSFNFVSNDVTEIAPLDFDKYSPSFGTPLHISIVRTIENNLPGKLQQLPANSSRPDTLNVVILTDGQDRSPEGFLGEEGQRRVRDALAAKRGESAPQWFFTYMAEGQYTAAGPGMGFQENEIFQYQASSVFKGFDNVAQLMRGRARGRLERSFQELQVEASQAGGDDVYRGRANPAAANASAAPPPSRGQARSRGGGRGGSKFVGADREIVWE